LRKRNGLRQTKQRNGDGAADGEFGRQGEHTTLVFKAVQPHATLSFKAYLIEYASAHRLLLTGVQIFMKEGKKWLL
jgi:hypothetical protein